MVKDAKRIAGIWALAGLLGVVAYAQIKNTFGEEVAYSRKLNRGRIERTLEGIANGEVPNGPVYDSKTLPSSHCARYVRMSAKYLFGKDYPFGDAWDLRNENGVGEIRVESYDALRELSKNGKLKPGMVLGIYNPKSNYNSQAKNSGAGYTHVALFLGEKDGTLYFADQFGSQIRTKISDSDLSKKGLQPREVLFLEN